jgi:hypothetical protein
LFITELGVAANVGTSIPNVNVQERTSNIAKNDRGVRETRPE